MAVYPVACVLALDRRAAGEGRVDRCKGILPFPEMRDYVRRVLALYGRILHVFDGSLTATSPTCLSG